jgi:hypothetical protein
VDDIIHGARVVPQRRVAGQKAVWGPTVTHRDTLSKAREVCDDCLAGGYHKRLPLRGDARQNAHYQKSPHGGVEELGTFTQIGAFSVSA